MNARTWISPGIVAGLGLVALFSLGGRPTDGAVSLEEPEQVAAAIDQVEDVAVTDLTPANTEPDSATTLSLICCEDGLGNCTPWNSRKCPSGETPVDCPCIWAESSGVDDVMTR